MNQLRECWPELFLHLWAHAFKRNASLPVTRIQSGHGKMTTCLSRFNIIPSSACSCDSSSSQTVVQLLWDWEGFLSARRLLMRQVVTQGVTWPPPPTVEDCSFYLCTWKKFNFSKVILCFWTELLSLSLIYDTWLAALIFRLKKTSSILNCSAPTSSNMLIM